MFHSHTGTSNSGSYTVFVGVHGCAECHREHLINRLVQAARQANPYVRPYRDLERIVALVEGTDGPKVYHKLPPARNEWQWGGERLNLYATWFVNWVFEGSVYADSDYGFVQLGLGPFRLHLYGRWGLTEEEREQRWIEERLHEFNA